jgi:hypothetical protein
LFIWWNTIQPITIRLASRCRRLARIDVREAVDFPQRSQLDYRTESTSPTLRDRTIPPFLRRRPALPTAPLAIAHTITSWQFENALTGHLDRTQAEQESCTRAFKQYDHLWWPTARRGGLRTNHRGEQVTSTGST